MKTLAVIQARMGSTRLPGKVLQDVGGRPMLARVVERVRRATLVDEVVVATSDSPKDDAIRDFCEQENISCFRGSESDVLDRFYGAAKRFGAATIVRITADCPVIDPFVIDEVIRHFQRSECDYASNTMRPTYPDGLDTEVFSFAALESAWREATKPSEREHVTPYLRLSGKFKTTSVEMSPDLSRLRLTVDDPVDLSLIREVYDSLGENGTFGLNEILLLLEKRPEMARLNAKTIGNEGYFRSLYTQAKAGPAPKLKLWESRAWLERSLEVIPTGAQTFSKSSVQYVQGSSPIFLARGKGCRVWDVDGNEYIDYVQGLLPNILGYAHDEVNAAVTAQLASGHSFSLAHPIEVELAERLTRLIPCAEMVRFGKNGSDVTAGAVRAARAFTGREHVACCGYHGWQDWYIGSTTRSAGVPEGVRSLVHPFTYNKLESLEAIFAKYPKGVAAVIMEPVNFTEPEPGFLQGVKELAHKHGALLIFDEICSGFHFGLGGAQKHYNVTPDLACFGKAMGNGFPIACIVGRREVMKTFEEIFYSFTFAGDAAAMAAAMKVLDILEQSDALARMESSGRVLKDGFNALAKEAGLSSRFECVGNPRWSLMKFRDKEGKDSLLERSLFQQEATKRGILMLVTHNMSAAHDSASVDKTLEAYAGVFKTLSQWLSDADPSRHLEGKPIEPVFRVR